ncbi:hypothetical protein C7447_103344 [Tenacibaculum adriaticum]|uniref:DUF4142 domain-containing protein n=1 Tax=Tenacibaculum adriaticum TaxID=413713 RepID=A0A5S5DR62_9FLAO|nr:hypothetical protein [Tenacibaculum adriaticum]TYP98174.1 hypothetical protein C7447_103344 [Tenacibaculum adriaticum]
MMKFRRNKLTITGLVAVALVITNFNSCDSFIKSKKCEVIKTSRIERNILTYKDEAKLLVMASKNNLDVIELCKIIEKEETDKIVVNLVEQIKDEHIEIFEKYNEVALENVISIPNYPDIKQGERAFSNTDDLEVNLKLLSNKINNQIELLEKLSDTTDNLDFKELATWTNNTLKENLNKTTETLTELNFDS